jgi:hypothetical protein
MQRLFSGGIRNGIREVHVWVCSASASHPRPRLDRDRGIVMDWARCNSEQAIKEMT